MVIVQTRCRQCFSNWLPLCNSLEFKKYSQVKSFFIVGMGSFLGREFTARSTFMSVNVNLVRADNVTMMALSVVVCFVLDFCR